ncbi:ribonuclease BN [Chloropicon primus]|uniref:Ribonuclease BN n=1 Tax=Chloropicon primus TaxID=1764295 RepID=A0A5B8N1C0_9CHLO|nr:ribonuclease BN [Chloropicon primus]UPR05287.1 ribonuclease BN [Chloropicon primus]|eukprot:QDZ26086.1 ribonuclease BN [Chloropicon primus]
MASRRIGIPQRTTTGRPSVVHNGSELPQKKCNGSGLLVRYPYRVQHRGRVCGLQHNGSGYPTTASLGLLSGGGGASGRTCFHHHRFAPLGLPKSCSDGHLLYTTKAGAARRGGRAPCRSSAVDRDSSSSSSSSPSSSSSGHVIRQAGGRRNRNDHGGGKVRAQDKAAFEAHMKGIKGYDKEHLYSARNLTGLQLTFLGTSGGAPTLNRNVTSLALEISVHRSVNETWLFDCGEATQTRLMQSNLKITNLTKIFITHMHGDHIFGLPGLLCMISNARNKVIKEQHELANQSSLGGRQARGGKGGGGNDTHWASQPIHIYGPPGLAQYITMSLGLSETGLSVPLVIHEFSDRPDSGGEETAEQKEKDQVNNANIFATANHRLKNKIRVEALPADSQSLAIRSKIIQTVNRDPENAKKYSWRKQQFGKNGNVRGNQGALDRWECMRWHLDLYEANEAIEVVACPLKHRVDCWGYVIKEKDQPGKMDTEKVKMLGLRKGPILKDLKNGETVQCPNTGKWIKPEDVLGPSKPGRKVVILGDTSDNRWVAQNAKDADVVVQEATFSNEMRMRAFASGHSTAGMAGSFAKYVDAGSLILTHFSARFEDMGGSYHSLEELRRSSKNPGKLKDLLAAERDQEYSSIALLKKQAIEKFGKKSVFAAEDLMVFCVEKKDPHNREAPSLVFPRRLTSGL